MVAVSPPLHGEQEKVAVYRLVFSTGVYKLFPSVLIYSVGLATLWPVIPTLVTNGFASQAAGYDVDCELYVPANSPEECRNAHSQAVMWNSWTSFVSGSILSFLFAPFVGKFTDDWGRKPFMLAGIALGFAPVIALMLFTWGWAKIEWYYPMTALNGIMSSFTISLTSVADLLHQKHRAAAVGYISACFSVGVLVGPVLGGYIDTEAAVYVCLGMTGATFIYVAVFVPETAPRVLAHRRLLAGLDTDEEGQLPQPLMLDEPPNSGVTGQASGAADGKATLLAGQQGSSEEVPWKIRLLEGQDGDAAVRKLGGSDPIPTVVAHEHTLLVQDAPSDESISGCGKTKASSNVDSPGGPKPLALSIDSRASSKSSRAPVVRGAWSDMLVGWRVIRGSSYYHKLVVIWIIVAMTLEGSKDLLMQYLQLKLGFTKEDLAHVLIITAAFGLVIKVFALAEMVRLLGEQKLLALGLSSFMFQNLLLGLATTKACALAAIGVGSLSCVNWPASVALQTRYADPCDIGAVQGALSGISSLASGLGPIAFAFLFRAFSHTDSSLPYFPQIVWYLLAALTLITVLLTATLHLNEPGAKKTSPPDEQYVAPSEQMPEAHKAGAMDVTSNKQGPQPVATV